MLVISIFQYLSQYATTIEITDILIQFFSGSNAPFRTSKFDEMKDTTETVGQHDSTETAHKNCVKLCIYERHNV